MYIVILWETVSDGLLLHKSIQLHIQLSTNIGSLKPASERVFIPWYLLSAIYQSLLYCILDFLDLRY